MPANRCSVHSISFPVMVKQCPVCDTTLTFRGGADVDDNWPILVARLKSDEDKQAELEQTPPFVRVNVKGNRWVRVVDLIDAGMFVPIERDGLIFEAPTPLGPKLFEVVGSQDGGRELLVRKLETDPAHFDWEA